MLNSNSILYLWFVHASIIEDLSLNSTHTYWSRVIFLSRLQLFSFVFTLKTIWNVSIIYSAIHMFILHTHTHQTNTPTNRSVNDFASFCIAHALLCCFVLFCCACLYICVRINHIFALNIHTHARTCSQIPNALFYFLRANASYFLCANVRMVFCSGMWIYI